VAPLEGFQLTVTVELERVGPGLLTDPGIGFPGVIGAAEDSAGISVVRKNGTRRDNLLLLPRDGVSGWRRHPDADGIDGCCLIMGVWFVR
jgi:hypothetical protein